MTEQAYALINTANGEILKTGIAPFSIVQYDAGPNRAVVSTDSIKNPRLHYGVDQDPPNGAWSIVDRPDWTPTISSTQVAVPGGVVSIRTCPHRCR